MNAVENNFKTHQSYECFNACIVNQLSYIGYSVTGSDIFFIGKYDGFINVNRNDNEFSIYDEQSDASFQFCKKVGLDYQIEYINKKENLDILEAMIAEFGCVTLEVSTPYLKYSKVLEQVDVFHFINILKIDRIRNMAYISDGYVPNIKPSIYEGWMPLPDLLIAWSKTNCKALTVHGLSHEKILKKELDRSYTYMLDSIKKYGLIEGINEKLLSVFESSLSQISDPKEYEDFILNYIFQLKLNGFLSYKYYILQQIEKYNFTEQEAYKRVINNWTGWMLNLMKVRSSCNYEKIMRVHEKGILLIDKERECFIKILNEFQ
jgi:hypothetical protein